MLSFLKVTFKYGAGLAGLASFIFLSITQQWISSSAFDKLNPDQTLHAFIISLTLATGLAICFLVCYIMEKRTKPAQMVVVSASNNSNAISNSGNGSVTINGGKK